MLKGLVAPDGTPIGADGESILPDGVQDFAALDGESKLDQALEDQLQDLLGDELQDPDKSKARFKLEVVFNEKRSRQAPYLGIVFAWTNGGFAHGGGDEVVYFCSGKVVRDDRIRTCNAPIDLKFVSEERAVCPTCKNVVDPKTLTGQVIAKLPTQHWTTLITNMFMLLDANADLRIGMMPGDLRGATDSEQERPQEGDRLNGVRNQRHWIHYSLVDIIKDTSAGSSFHKRIRAFLEA